MFDSRVQGAVDAVTPDHASGWVYVRSRHTAAVVQAMLGTELLGESAATLPRADLRAIGMGDGNCGFEVEFARRIDPLYLPFVVFQVDGGDLQLPRWSASGLVEFLPALYERHPATSRHRSLFGGLWTDRLDAVALLHGKSAIGLIPREEHQLLFTFIQEGLGLIGVDSRLHDPHDLTAETLAPLLPSRLIRYLELIFEDRPAIVLSKRLEPGLPFVQPSTLLDLPSRTECILIVIAAGDRQLEIEFVRDGHSLPEFASDGISRWVGNGEFLGWSSIPANVPVGVRVLPPGFAALVGPGLPYRIVPSVGTSVLAMLALPGRNVPLYAVEASDNQISLASGVRILRLEDR